MLMIIKCSNCDYEDFSISGNGEYLICKRCNEEIFVKDFEYNYDLLDKKAYD